jgi:hypothetical protein
MKRRYVSFDLIMAVAHIRALQGDPEPKNISARSCAGVPPARDRESGVDRVLEETVTRHHLWELADLAALAGEMNLHVHVCRSAFPCMQRPRLAAMSNHFLFFVRVLRSLEKRACFS